MSEFIKKTDTVRFGVTTHNPSGGALKTADEAPRWRVFEEASDTSILDGLFTVRTGYDGTYRATFDATIGNGFNSNSYYEIHASGKVDGIVGRAIIKTFVLDDIFDANMVEISGDKLAGAFVTAELQAATQASIDAIETDTATTIPGTITTLQSDTDDIQTRLPAALVGGLMSSDVTAISTDTTAADNLELQYDTGGIVGDNFPATQAQANRFSSGSAAISTTAKPSPNGFVITTGLSEVNDEDSTFEENGVYHQLSPDTGTTDCYYEFTIGGNGVPVSVTWWGYMQSKNDTYNYHAYNWSTPGWEQVGSRDGGNNTGQKNDTLALTLAHVGTAANVGLVRFRIESTTGTLLSTDRILCNYSVVAESVGYADGAIWYNDTVANTNTEVYVDGVADNPVSSWAAALTLSSALNIDRFRIANGSSVTLSGNTSNKTLIGEQWTLDLNAQNIKSASFSGADDVSGSGIGNSARFRDCHVRTAWLDGCWLTGGRISGHHTFTEDGGYFYEGCFANTFTLPVIHYASGSIVHCITGFSGGAEFRNIKTDDKIHVEGEGELLLDVSCSGGEFDYAGDFRFTNNGTISAIDIDDNTVNIANIENTVWDAAQSGHLAVDTFGYALQPVYYANIKYVKDAGNGSDEYAVCWYKDAIPVESGSLTNPAISVYNTNSGANLFANQTMDYASTALGVVRYDSTLLTPSGEPFVVHVSGVIDSVSRTWKQIVGLDDIF